MPITYEHQRDLEAIFDTLSEYCKQGEYISLYNETVTELNHLLSTPLPLIKRQWTVEQTYSVVRTITVTADSEDDAEEVAGTADYFQDLTRGDWEIYDVTLEHTSIVEDDD